MNQNLSLPTNLGIDSFQDFVVQDAGLEFNRERHETIYDPGDIMHYHGTAPNGIRVHIERRQLSFDAYPMFRVAFGVVNEHSEMPPLVTRDQAVRFLQEAGVI